VGQAAALNRVYLWFGSARPQIVAQPLFARTLFLVRFQAGFFASRATRRSKKKRAALKIRGPQILVTHYLVVLVADFSRRPNRALGKDTGLFLMVAFVSFFFVNSARAVASILARSIL